MIFGLFVGASTPNFSGLVRYKIPCLPFYLIALFIVLDIVKTKKIKQLSLDAPTPTFQLR
jgi:hypothetical protein